MSNISIILFKIYKLFPQVLLAKYTYPKRPDLRIVVTDDHPFDINAYLLPFAIVVGICFVIMLIIVIYKCVQDYRRSRRHRLPKSALKKLPIHKFKQVRFLITISCLLV